MKIAIYTLTRDRLEYTQRSFSLLWERAGYTFDHYIIDNGSEDGTQAWLDQNTNRFYRIFYNTTNVGISLGSNQALDMIQESGVAYDLVVKLDNDCEIVSEGLMARMVEVYQIADKPMLLSPRVEGVSHQPVREYNELIGSYTIGRTGIVGGLCHWLPAVLYQQFRYPVNLPLAKGQDDSFCDWIYRQNFAIGYVEDLVVRHMDTTIGQATKYPDYFQRKWKEEKIATT